MILAYHRVIDLPSDPQMLAVTPKHFAQQLEVIRRLATPVPLTNVPRAAGHAFVSRPCVAVTFDDGYPDNLQFAKPLLQRFAVPATVFVVTGSVNADREFWWDELERLLLLPPELPPKLDLAVGPAVLRWHFDRTADMPDPAWTIAVPGPRPARRRAYLTLARELARLSPGPREDVLATLVDWSGQSRTCRPTYRSMTSAELHSLRTEGLVTLGAHTTSHPMLAQLTPAEQRTEIEASKQWLDQTFGGPVTSFAYPHGTRDAYTRHTTELVRRAGFTCACSTAGRTVSFLDDPMELPRCTVRDWDGREFEQRLRGWLHT